MRTATLNPHCHCQSAFSVTPVPILSYRLPPVEYVESAAVQSDKGPLSKLEFSAFEFRVNGSITMSYNSRGSWGWSGGAMVLGKLPVPGRPITLDYSRVRAFCAGSRCEWGLFGHFFSRLSYLFSFSLSLGDDPV